MKTCHRSDFLRSEYIELLQPDVINYLNYLTSCSCHYFHAKKDFSDYRLGPQEFHLTGHRAHYHLTAGVKAVLLATVLASVLNQKNFVALEFPPVLGCHQDRGVQSACPQLCAGVAGCSVQEIVSTRTRGLAGHVAPSLLELALLKRITFTEVLPLPRSPRNWPEKAGESCLNCGQL